VNPDFATFPGAAALWLLAASLGALPDRFNPSSDGAALPDGAAPPAAGNVLPAARDAQLQQPAILPQAALCARAALDAAPGLVVALVRAVAAAAAAAASPPDDPPSYTDQASANAGGAAALVLPGHAVSVPCLLSVLCWCSEDAAGGKSPEGEPSPLGRQLATELSQGGECVAIQLEAVAGWGWPASAARPPAAGVRG
jgi:hypothetical protein